MIRLGLPKGRMAADSWRFCQALDVTVVGGVLKYGTTVAGVPVSILFLKPADVARLLAQNLIDLGLTGEEWLFEAGLSPICRCFEVGSYYASLCLLMARGDTRPIAGISRIATPFPHWSRSLLNDMAPEARVLSVGGSTEALVPDVAEACVDVVESGRTAAMNGLVARARLATVTTCLARSEASDVSFIGPIIDLLSASEVPHDYSD
jgi:ATP phosphoribosyltransferase